MFSRFECNQWFFSLSLCLLLTLVMVISFLTYRLLSFIIGILYPSYQTYKSLKYHSSDQYPSLLSYWLLFGLFQIYEFFFDQIVSLVIPFYNELKLFFLFWLTYRNVSQLIFNHFLVLFVDRYEEDIDYLLNHTIHRLTELFVKGLLFILQQQRILPTAAAAATGDSNSFSRPLKTNFAAQFRHKH